MCAVFDVQGRDGDSPAHNESDFYFWKVVRDISAVTQVLRDVLAMQMPKIKKTLFNGKIWALGKLIIYTMICCYFLSSEMKVIITLVTAFLPWAQKILEGKF